MRRAAAIILLGGVFGFAVPAAADQTDPRLDGLFEDLGQASASAEAAPIEREIWEIWGETGDGEAASLMLSGVEALRQGAHQRALEEFDRLVAIAPDFAEAWNKRATVHYVLDNLEESLDDIKRTLELEPRHFGALSGRGLVHVKRNDAQQALEAFEAALAIHPQMPGARVNAAALRDLLGQQDI